MRKVITRQTSVDSETGVETVSFVTSEVSEDAPTFVTTVAAEQVKQEAERRILQIVPEWKQRNLLAQATILAKIGPANWTTEQQAAWDAGEAIWTQVAAIRAASDAIEALDPIPQDFNDDARWP